MDKLEEYRNEFGKGIFWSDGHNDPRDTEEQFEVNSALGLFCLKEKPDVMVNNGDHWNLRSLNTRRGSSMMGTDAPEEGQDLYADIAIGEDAYKAFEAHFTRENERHRRNGHAERGCYPLRVNPYGNHEDFVVRLTKKYHPLKNTVSLRTLMDISAKYGWLALPYMKPVILGGICIRHVQPGDNIQPLGIDRWLGFNCMSSVSGHGHKYQIRETVRPDGIRQTAMMLPSAMHPSKMYGRMDTGVVIVRNARAGQFRHEFVQMDEILEEFRDWKMESTRRNNFKSKTKAA